MAVTIGQLNTYASNLPVAAWFEGETGAGAPFKISPAYLFGHLENLTQLSSSTVASGDRFLVYDISAAAGAQAKYVTADGIFAGPVGSYTYVTTPAVSDLIPFSSSGSARAVSPHDLFSVGNNFATFTDPQTTDKLFALDGSTPKAITISALFNIITQFTTFATLVDNASGLLIYRHSDGTIYGLTPNVLATGKETIWMPAGAMAPATTNGPTSAQVETSSNKINVKGLQYANDATVRWAHFSVAFPKSTNVGATVTFIPYWYAPAGSGDIVWQLQAVAVSNDDVIDASFSSSVTSTDTLTATTDLMVGPESGALTIAGTWATGDMVFFRVGRDAGHASDNFNNTGTLLGVRVIFGNNSRDDA